MKSKTKKMLYRILKLVWIIIGVLNLIFIGLIYNKMLSPTGLGIILWVVLFSYGIYFFILYIGTTILFLFIKWLIKKFRKKMIKKEKPRKVMKIVLIIIGILLSMITIFLGIKDFNENTISSAFSVTTSGFLLLLYIWIISLVLFIKWLSRKVKKLGVLS